MSTPDPVYATYPITIILSKNSLRNATYSCDAAGIHFRISTPTEGIRLSRLTSVYRWNKDTSEEELVAQWEHNTGKMDRFSVRGLTSASVTGETTYAEQASGRISGDPSPMFVSRQEFLPKSGGVPLTAFG